MSCISYTCISFLVSYLRTKFYFLLQRSVTGCNVEYFLMCQISKYTLLPSFGIYQGQFDTSHIISGQNNPGTHPNSMLPTCLNFQDNAKVRY